MLQDRLWLYLAIRSQGMRHQLGQLQRIGKMAAAASSAAAEPPIQQRGTLLMSHPTISKTRVDDAILFVSIDRPEKRNA